MLELVLKAVVEGKCGDFCMSLICTVIVHMTVTVTFLYML